MFYNNQRFKYIFCLDSVDKNSTSFRNKLIMTYS